MRKKNYKGRCTKRYVAKCTDVCRTYDPLQTAYADVLAINPDIEEFRCNVYLDGLTDGDYTSDFLCKKTDGTYMVRECVYRSRLLKPMNIQLFDLDGGDFGIVVKSYIVHQDTHLNRQVFEIQAVSDYDYELLIGE